MATMCEIFSLKEFQIAIQKETTAGTAAITDAGSETILAIDAVDNATVSKGVYRDTAVHMGKGRTKKTGDNKTSVKGQLNTITFSMYADQTIAKYLFENLIGGTVGTSPASFDIPTGFTSKVCIGDTDTDWTGLFSLALVEPSGYASASRVLRACKVESYTYKCGNSDADGGRAMVDITIGTDAAIAEGVDGSSWTVTPYSTTQERYIMDLFSSASVSQIGGVDVALDSFSLTFNGNVTRHSYAGSNGMSYLIATGMPNIEVLGDFTVKDDSNTVDFLDEISGTTDLVVAFHNAVWVSATFGFMGGHGRIRDSFQREAINEGSYFTIPIEFLDNSTDDLIQVVL